MAALGQTTQFIHAGKTTDPLTGAVNVPIYQTATFRQPEFGGTPEWEYARTGNPTRAALERLIAELEGGAAGFAFASGMAAITTVILAYLSAGEEVIIPTNVYGGTYRVLDQVFNRFNITYKIVDTTRPHALEQAISSNTAAVIVESPANPLMSVTDLTAVAAVARENGALTIVDNTFMTPYLQRPLELGADIVIHSATKYLGGHSDVVAGLVVTATEELGERMGFVQNATGGVLGPQDGFLLVRGIKTLGVRMDRHQQNAQFIAEQLLENEAVSSVHYPGLHSDAGYEVNCRQAAGPGAMISFELAEGHDISTFFQALKLVALAESLGGVESLVCHPATMTHAAIPASVREQVGITDRLIRLSVGIEDTSDIWADIAQALAQSRHASVPR